MKRTLEQDAAARLHPSPCLRRAAQIKDTFRWTDKSTPSRRFSPGERRSPTVSTVTGSSSSSQPLINGSWVGGVSFFSLINVIAAFFFDVSALCSSPLVPGHSSDSVAERLRSHSLVQAAAKTAGKQPASAAVFANPPKIRPWRGEEDERRVRWSEARRPSAVAK